MKQAPNIARINWTDAQERGAIVLELALILPLLVMLFSSIIDLGLLVREHQIVQNAAREGARFSSLPQNCISCRPADCNGCPGGCNAPNCMTQSDIQTAIENRVIGYLAQEGITVTASDITIDQCLVIPVTVAGTTVNARASQVTVTYNRALLVSGFFSVGNVTLTGSSVFRDLYGPNCP
jgi:hypothetical protein